MINKLLCFMFGHVFYIKKFTSNIYGYICGMDKTVTFKEVCKRHGEIKP